MINQHKWWKSQYQFVLNLGWIVINALLFVHLFQVSRHLFQIVPMDATNAAIPEPLCGNLVLSGSSCCLLGCLSRPGHSSLRSQSSESGPMPVRCVAMVPAAGTSAPWCLSHGGAACPGLGSGRPLRPSGAAGSRALLSAIRVGGRVVGFKFVISSHWIITSRFVLESSARWPFVPTSSACQSADGSSASQPPLASVASFSRLRPVGSVRPG